MAGTLNEQTMNKLIGLIDVDGHAKKKLWGGTIHPNIALGKIARWHKQQGDTVEWAEPVKGPVQLDLFGNVEPTGNKVYDKIYASKVFNFSPDFDRTKYCTREWQLGGTGYDVHSMLTAFGFLTRGCPNKCKWCVVPRKEGAIHPYMDVDEIAIEGRKKLVLMDNNIIAAGDYAKEQMRKIMKWIDRRIRFGCDTTAQVPHCERAMQMLNDAGYHGEYFIYIMLNDDFQESYGRIDYWSWRSKESRRLKLPQRIYPHSQPYRDPMKTVHEFPQWQKDVTHWVN